MWFRDARMSQKFTNKSVNGWLIYDKNGNVLRTLIMPVNENEPLVLSGLVRLPDVIAEKKQWEVIKGLYNKQAAKPEG